jgi:hypothetical protein
MADIGILFLLWATQKKGDEDDYVPPINGEQIQDPPTTISITKDVSNPHPWVVPN